MQTRVTLTLSEAELTAILSALHQVNPTGQAFSKVEDILDEMSIEREVA